VFGEGGEVVHVDVTQPQVRVLGAQSVGQGREAFGGQVAGGDEDEAGLSAVGVAQVGPRRDAVAQLVVEGGQGCWGGWGACRR
jgi:hypothetical protein